MDAPQAISQIRSLKGQKENEAIALGLALDLLEDGYQSDREQMNTAIAAATESIIAAKNAELDTAKARIEELEALLAPDDTEE